MPAGRQYRYVESMPALYLLLLVTAARRKVFVCQGQCAWCRQVRGDGVKAAVHAITEQIAYVLNNSCGLKGSDGTAAFSHNM